MEKRHNYVRKVAETAVQLFLTNDKANVSGLILAGSADFKTELSQSDMFDQRLQAKIARLIGRIQRHGDFAGCSCTSIRPATRGFGSVLEFGGEGGPVVTVSLSVELDGEKPRLGVSYDLAHGAEPELARPVLTDVMAALRA